MISAYRKLLDLIGIAVGISIGLIALVIPLDLLLRSMRIASMPWLSEVVEYTLFAGVFLAAPWVLSLNSHVRVDLLATSLPARLATLLDVLLDSLGLAIACAFIWFSCAGTMNSFRFATMIRRSLTIPEWWLLTLFTVSMGLIAVQFMIRLADDRSRWHALAREG